MTCESNRKPRGPGQRGWTVWPRRVVVNWRLTGGVQPLSVGLVRAVNITFFVFLVDILLAGV